MTHLTGVDVSIALAELLRQSYGGFDRPYIVAIDGRSGTGKSTLATAIVAKLDAAIIDGDSFFAGGIDVRSDSPQIRAAQCIDWQKQRDVIANLRAGRFACWFPFDWDAFDGRLAATAIHVAAKPLIILEGVYSARPELADQLDLRILLTVPDDVRVQRLQAREGGIGPWERQWHEAEDWYFNHVAPAAWFDIIVENH